MKYLIICALHTLLFYYKIKLSILQYRYESRHTRDKKRYTIGQNVLYTEREIDEIHDCLSLLSGKTI